MKIPCKTFDPAKHKQFRYAHYKRDGHFTTVQRFDNGVTVWSSKPEDITPKIYFLPMFKDFERLPVGTVVIGELWLPGSRAEAIKTAINERNKNLKFSAFAITKSVLRPSFFGGSSLDDLPLLGCAEYLKHFNISFCPWVDLFESRKSVAATINEPLPPETEGYVFKNSNLSEWVKWKPRKTVDLIITGYEPGTGKFAGKVGSIICSTVEDFEVANVSGMTDIQRDWITANQLELMGKICEVEYQCVGSQGRLRHPSFVSLRDDKETERCGIEQDIELQAYWSKQQRGRLF